MCAKDLRKWTLQVDKYQGRTEGVKITMQSHPLYYDTD